MAADAEDGRDLVGAGTLEREREEAGSGRCRDGGDAEEVRGDGRTIEHIRRDLGDLVANEGDGGGWKAADAADLGGEQLRRSTFKGSPPGYTRITHRTPGSL